MEEGNHLSVVFVACKLNYLDCQDGTHLVSVKNMVAMSAHCQGAIKLDLQVAKRDAWVEVWEVNLHHFHSQYHYYHHPEVRYAHPAGHQEWDPQVYNPVNAYLDILETMFCQTVLG
jgi:hypothetical protein